MKLTPPKQVTWWVAIIVGVLGFLGSLVTIPGISGLSFWLVFIGFALLALATAIEDL